MINKRKKPQADMEVKCPHCLSLLRVKFWRQRQDEPPEPDYAVDVEVEILKQGRLFEADKTTHPVKGKGQATVERMATT